MSDEETDEENTGFLIQRSPKWRNQLVTKLLAKLDEKYQKNAKIDKSRLGMSQFCQQNF